MKKLICKRNTIVKKCHIITYDPSFSKADRELIRKAYSLSKTDREAICKQILDTCYPEETI